LNEIIDPERRREYEECDQKIAEVLAANMEAFVTIGLELKRMSKGLYRAGGFKTFEDYYEKKPHRGCGPPGGAWMSACDTYPREHPAR
jgi:hypothetical protein